MLALFDEGKASFADTIEVNSVDLGRVSQCRLSVLLSVFDVSLPALLSVMVHTDRLGRSQARLVVRPRFSDLAHLSTLEGSPDGPRRSKAPSQRSFGRCPVLSLAILAGRTTRVFVMLLLRRCLSYQLATLECINYSTVATKFVEPLVGERRSRGRETNANHGRLEGRWREGHSARQFRRAVIVNQSRLREWRSDGSKPCSARELKIRHANVA